jgi:hypothetical protein
VFVRNLPQHDDQFVGATSGDEAYGMSRGLRTRAILRGTTTDKYDFFVAFDEYGRNSFVTALTAAQYAFGPTPYSLRLLNTLLFTVGVLLLFRLCRDAYGPRVCWSGGRPRGSARSSVRLAAEGVLVASSARPCSRAIASFGVRHASSRWRPSSPPRAQSICAWVPCR